MSIRLKFHFDPETWRKNNLSRFFHQEPCGCASGFHESIPSFIQRLAQEHAVLNGPFFLREVHPQPVPSSGSLLGRHSHCLLIGNGKAKQVAQKLAHECCEDQVMRMIQAPLSEHIALFRDLRPITAWCPNCLSEWMYDRKPVYRPLLWSFESVKICPRHKITLQDKCPHCSETFYHLDPNTWSIYCSSCGKSLLDGEPKRRRSEFENFAANEVSELLKWGWQCRDEDFPLNQFQTNIRQATDSVGGEYCLSEITGLSRAVIHSWRTEDRRPSLQGLINLSYSFDIPIQSWLTDALSTRNFSGQHIRQTPATSLSQRHPPLAYVRRRIQAFLDDSANIPCSLTSMAKQLNTSSYRLYRDCPELATQIVTRYAESRTRQKIRTRIGQENAVRGAIQNLQANGARVSRNAVLKMLKKQGVKSSWTLKKIFAEEMQRIQNRVCRTLTPRSSNRLALR